MSVRVMDAVWSKSDRKGAELLVLLALADWANDRGECDPSYSQLADKARVDKRRVRRIVQALRDAGEIEMVTGAGFEFGPGQQSNAIRLVAYVEAVPRGARAPTLGVPAPLGVGVPVPLPLGAPVPPSTVNYNSQQQQTEGAAEQQRPRRAPAAPAALGPGATVYREVCHRTPNAVQREALETAHDRYGPEALREACRVWMLHRWNPGNVAGIVDVAANDGIPRDPQETRDAQRVTRKSDGTLVVRIGAR